MTLVDFVDTLMVRLRFLQKWKGLLNIAEVARSIDMEEETLLKRLREGSPEFTPTQGQRMERLFKRNGVKERERMSKQEFKENTLLRLSGFIDRHKNLSNEIYKRYWDGLGGKGKEFTAQEEKAIGDILSKMANEL